MHDVLEPTADPAWLLQADGYDSLRETSLESRFAISNGFLGIRATRAVTRGASWSMPPRTYVAGLFDTAAADQALAKLVPAADWLQVRILLPDGPLVHHPGDVTSRRMTLDLKRGALLSEGCLLRPQDSTGTGLRGHVRTMRLVSLEERCIGLQLISFEIEQGDVEMTFEASFAGVNLGLVVDRLEHDIGVWHTQHTGKGLAMATASSLRLDGQELAPTVCGELACVWTWPCRPGQVVSFERFVAVVRTDTPGANPGDTARKTVADAKQRGVPGVVAGHAAAWAARWDCSDVAIEGDPAAQQALRFALYHLNGAADPTDERVSIGARALTGDDYHGHVFWDTEVYLLPFYTFTWPEAARTLLMYRFRTLDGARAKAARMGWRGAFYAWESADTGAETTPEHMIGPDRQIMNILCGTQEQHISADIAHAVWQYWQATGDEAFLRDAGAEILLETARFWASRAQPEADGRCHIRGVIGPDEYHEHIDDNAFTNVMARENIRRGLDAAALLRDRWPDRWATLSSSLGLHDVEMAHWRTVADAMVTGLDPKTGLFEQFAGYYGLEDIDLAAYAGRSVPMDVVLGRERVQHSQVIKQADVVALLALLPEEFAGKSATANFRYYEPRCSHGSSLSRAMHGIVAARLGATEHALRYFLETAEIDLGDAQVAIDGGVHIAALGGIWLMAVFGFAGLTMMGDGIALAPKLPPSWRRLAFPVQWHARSLQITIDQAKHFVDVTLATGEPMTVAINGQSHALGLGQPVRVDTGAALAA